jgi:transcriptional regulator with XRE-family HTH domain
MSLGLSQQQLSAKAGVSQQLISLVERGQMSGSMDALCQIAAGCGYEVGIRILPISHIPLRDSGQLAHVETILRDAAGAWHARVEMPVAPGDPRAADLVLIGSEEIIHFEVERAVVDLQAQLRPAQIKRDTIAASRDVPVRLVIALPDTQRNRALLREHAPLVSRSFPAASRLIWSRIRSGRPIGADGILFVPRGPARRHNSC